jgi:hypothetical protein
VLELNEWKHTHNSSKSSAVVRLCVFVVLPGSNVIYSDEICLFSDDQAIDTILVLHRYRMVVTLPTRMREAKAVLLLYANSTSSVVGISKQMSA